MAEKTEPVVISNAWLKDLTDDELKEIVEEIINKVNKRNPRMIRRADND